jgi:signal transduction histidine kinase
VKATSIESRLGDGLSRLPNLASEIIIAVGALILLGWTLDIRALIRLLPAMVTMNPVTAFTFILAGLSLWCLGGRHARSSQQLQHLGVALAGLVTFVGALKSLDYLVPLNFHIDHLLFARKLALPGLYPPSEMAPNTALNFLLCGLGLLRFQKGRRHAFCPSQLFVLTAGLIALLALIGYSYRVLFFYRMGATLPMSLDTALAFTLFCVGFLAAQADRGLMLLITSSTTGGTMARRLLPMAILVPWILGALLLMLEQAGYFGTESAVSLFAVASILIFTGLIGWNARLLYVNDVARVLAERRLAAQHNSTRVLAESPNLTSAMLRILQIICEGLGWQVGALWIADPQANTLRCAEVWQSSAIQTREFLENSRATMLSKGVGLPGRVWSQSEPLWISDALQDKSFRRSEAAAKAGLRAAVALPLWVGQDFFGVLEFFSRKTQSRSEAVLDMLSTVGTQLSLFIERTRAEEQLHLTSANLQRSNTDLQQFAYVASHDLFEPLRMITSYLQLLSQRCQSKLDPQGQEFIRFAVEGARRMNALIHDLLAYSRVDIRGRAFEPVECQQAFDAAIANLKVAIEESGAVIAHGPLPRVLGDAVQLTQVFQNLLGNAIKFRGPRPPQIEVNAHPHNGEWLFLVRDNGIGIDPKFFDRIFIIFQRLHTREQYAGTGLGLAICKKIIERHGGRIWVESTPGSGSTFLFTLPTIPEP